MILIAAYDEAIRRNMISGPGMIVVKASLKYQWAKEVEKFSDYKSAVVQTRSVLCLNINNRIKARENKLAKEKDTLKKKLLEAEIKALRLESDALFNSQFENVDLFILNYEALCDDEIKAAMHKLKLQFVGSDESHYIKNHKAERSKALHEFGNSRMKIESTATPVQKNYEDIYGLFKFLRPDFWTSHSKFAQMYIKYAGPGRIAGFKNVPHLQKKIAPHTFVKTKEEISSQLPSLVVLQRYCELDPKVLNQSNLIMEELKELRDQSDAIRAGFKTEKELYENQEFLALEARIMACQTFAQELADEPSLLANTSSEMAKRYAITGSYKNNKLESLVSLVTEIIDSGEKVAIFSRYERMQDIITQALHKADKKIKIAYVNGALDTKKRYEEVYTKFRDTDDYKVLLLTDAGAEGLNLSKCKYLIEYDLADSYAIQTQRHGRVERADSVHENVTVYQIIAKDSWDEVQAKIVAKKENMDFELIKTINNNK